MPRFAVGIIIGRNGEMIKKIQNDAGVRIQFKQGNFSLFELCWGFFFCFFFQSVIHIKVPKPFKDNIQFCGEIFVPQLQYSFKLPFNFKVTDLREFKF